MVSHKLEALGQTSHPELWTVGAMELLGAPAQQGGGTSEGSLGRALGTLPDKWQAGE